jgi:hypothetical protein
MPKIYVMSACERMLHDWQPLCVGAQLLVLDPGHLDVDVDPVQERAGNALLVFGDGGRRTGAGPDGIVVIAAGAGVHGRNELKVGRKGERTLCPADGDDLVLDGLAQHFQDAWPELGQFVQE